MNEPKPSNKFEIVITIDKIEVQDSLDILEMFKTMCAFSGCVCSTSRLHNTEEIIDEQVKEISHKNQLIKEIQEHIKNRMNTFTTECSCSVCSSEVIFELEKLNKWISERL